MIKVLKRTDWETLLSSVLFASRITVDILFSHPDLKVRPSKTHCVPILTSNCFGKGDCLLTIEANDI